MSNEETIVGVATASGQGAVGIIRLSGHNALNIGLQIIAKSHSDNFPVTRQMSLHSFYINDTDIIDKGLFVYFKAPFSFTGEDIVELQTHGGAVVLNLLLKRCVELGARLARAGEFSERAFLNDKMDLTQAEAIADLIEAQSEQAAKNAIASMQGQFSDEINTLSQQLLHLRLYVEAAMDFPDEDVDFIEDSNIKSQIDSISQNIASVRDKARQGQILRDGISVVLAGKPNAGKSTLLNRLTGEDTAIVTQVAGTTRDVLHEKITLDGLPLHITDTAGLRETDDEVEQHGIQRAKKAIEAANIVVWLVDVSDGINLSSQEQFYQTIAEIESHYPRKSLLILLNKVDALSEPQQQSLNTYITDFSANASTVSSIASPRSSQQTSLLSLSAKHAYGLDALTENLKNLAGLKQSSEGVFSARQRHLDALYACQQHLQDALQQLQISASGDLIAEDLKLAHQRLGEITGKISPDDLLGHIFSSFCIGK